MADKVISVIDTVLWEEEEWERLAHLGRVLRHDGYPDTHEEVIRRIADAEIVVVAEAKVPAAAIESCPQLEMISLWSTGYDHIDMEAARRRGVLVCHVPDYAAHSVAEHAMAMALALAKRLPQADAHVRSGLFSWQAIRGMELYGKTVGVVGTGAIGSRFSALAQGFGCRVLATTLHPSPERAFSLGVEYVDLSTLLRESDIISLHLPLSPATKGMLGKGEFEMMQKQPILINTARGSLIDPKALLWALDEGKIRGVGLDVLWEEPPDPDDSLYARLLKTDSVILSPHCGANTKEAFRLLTDICLKNIAHYLAGQPTNVVTQIGNLPMVKDMLHISLPYGSGEIGFDLPAENFGEKLEPQAICPSRDLPDLLTRSLDQPIGTPRLEELVSPSDEVAIICDDITRPTPARKILPQVVERLLSGGVGRKQIKIVIALGTHRLMTEEEIEAKIGAEMRSEFEVAHSSVEEMEAYLPLGLSPRGITIEVLREVADAKVKIGIGDIVPHADAGWGGGAKIILPGVCSARTVAENHVLAADFGGSQLGAVNTPLREDMERTVERIGLDFIINTVLLPSGRCYAVLAGHYQKAHRVGIPLAKEIYGVPFNHPTDIVVSSAYPYDRDFWQGSKGLWAGERLTKSGGSLILVAPCSEGLGPHGNHYSSYIGADPKGFLQALKEGKIEDKTAGAGAVQIHLMKAHLDISMVTHGLSPSTVEAMGFRYYQSLQEAVEERLAFHGREARVSVITHGGYLCPLKRGEGEV